MVNEVPLRQNVSKNPSLIFDGNNFWSDFTDLTAELWNNQRVNKKKVVDKIKVASPQISMQLVYL
jgi:hypothetical protein